MLCCAVLWCSAVVLCCGVVLGCGDRVVQWYSVGWLCCGVLLCCAWYFVLLCGVVWCSVVKAGESCGRAPGQASDHALRAPNPLDSSTMTRCLPPPLAGLECSVVLSCGVVWFSVGL